MKMKRLIFKRKNVSVLEVPKSYQVKDKGKLVGRPKSRKLAIEMAKAKISYNKRHGGK